MLIHVNLYSNAINSVAGQWTGPIWASSEVGNRPILMRYVNIEGYKFGGWTGPIWVSSEVENQPQVYRPH